MKIKIYHGSPREDLKYLKKGSYVTGYPHIAEILGMYHEDTGNVWNDNDLNSSYNFGQTIHFKKNRKPTGKATIYCAFINEHDLTELNNNANECIIKIDLNVEIFEINDNERTKSTMAQGIMIK